jgi:hypothetical protein
LPRSWSIVVAVHLNLAFFGISDFVVTVPTRKSLNIHKHFHFCVAELPAIQLSYSHAFLIALILLP